MKKNTILIGIGLCIAALTVAGCCEDIGPIEPYLEVDPCFPGDSLDECCSEVCENLFNLNLHVLDQNPDGEATCSCCSYLGT